MEEAILTEAVPFFHLPIRGAQSHFELALAFILSIDGKKIDRTIAQIIIYLITQLHNQADSLTHCQAVHRKRLITYQGNGNIITQNKISYGSLWNIIGILTCIKCDVKILTFPFRTFAFRAVAGAG